MCQLTYSNLGNAYLNSLMIYTLGKNGSKRHDDGTGFICPNNTIWKSEVAAENILNLGEIITKRIIGTEPIPFHIRSATYGIEVNKENSHPFDGKHFILMHNGTLLPRNGEETKDKKHDSDSLKFLNSLDECKDINPQGTFEEIFNAAMANFAGKFAFIIREKETNNDYIVRGRTAELWISELFFDGVKKGYVINTSKDTMKESFKEFVNIWDLFFSETCKFTEPSLLEQESIFLAKETEVNKIGETLEVEPKEKKEIVVGSRGRSYYDRNNYWGDSYDNEDNKDILEKAKKIHDFLSDHSMGLIDFQLMIMISGGISILELTEEDLNMFIDYLIPKISANKKVKAEVKSILNGLYFPEEVYEKYKLEYPWTVNDGEVVIKALKEYVKEI